MRLRNKSIILIAALTAICIEFRPSSVSGSSELRLTDGHYRRLLIFLEEDSATSLSVEHYALLLRNIRTGFEQASSILASLTEPAGRRLRFGDVSVLVSARLGRQLAQRFPNGSLLHPLPADWHRRDRADFFASPDLAVSDEGPESVVAACARPALRVLLAAESLEPRSSDSLGRRLALYFSQYRWGLLSEAPIGSLLQTVATFGGKRQYRAASCSPTLKTELQITGGSGGSSRTCAFNLDTKRLSENCSIVVTERPNANAASFLFAPYSAGVTRFCDSVNRASSPNMVHNKGADNLFNRHCGGQSAADILRMHDDFQGAARTAAVDLGVKFQLVAEADKRRVVIVMDTSGSMAADNRINNMIGAVNQFLTEVLENGAECALISFNTGPTVLENLLTIDSAAVRQRLAQAVSGLTAIGGTCIGGAVRRAMQLLGVNPSRPNRRSTGQIILLSDGQEGCSTVLDSVISAISTTSLEVVSIRYGDKADTRISRLAEVTGGRQFFGEAAGADAAGGLAAAGLRLSLGGTTAGVAAAERIITLATQEVQPNFQRRLEFNVDGSIRRDLAFVLSFPAQPAKAASLRLMIRSPSGNTFNCTGGSDSACTVDIASGTVSVRIPDSDIEVGRWTIENLSASTVRHLHRRFKRQTSTVSSGLVVITGRPAPAGSKSSSAELPTTLSGDVIPARVQAVTEATRIGVYSRLLRGYTPVRGARLFAVVRSNEGRVARFNLTDNGAGADLKANDGAYSGYIPAEAVKSPRDYSISVICTAPVSRVASAGKLTVVAGNPSFDNRRTPPLRITDLTINISVAERSARLSWTAVDDPSGLSGDVAPTYTVRFASSPEELLSNFSTSQEIFATSNTSVNVFNRIASLGIRQTYLAVAAISTANVTGAVSNVVVLDNPTEVPSVAELKSLGIDVVAEVDPHSNGCGNRKSTAVIIFLLATCLLVPTAKVG